MRLEPLENPVGEEILSGTAATGLRVLVAHRPGWARTFAAFGTNFGSVDRVGGPDGQPVPEGLAHFLEHKLFEDESGDVSDRFAAFGASTNAMTGFSGTTYVASTVTEPRRCVELLLQFVQRPHFTEALVAKEQGIIAQEIRMYDDDPDWRVFFGLLDAMYAHHPVRDNIAGTVQSIARIDPATLRRCYDLFYRPANMTLVVAGALPAGEVAEIVEADQAGRPLDRLGPHRRVPPDEPTAVRLARLEERLPVARPRLLLGIKEGVLGGGARAVLRRELQTRILLDLLFGRSSSAWEALYADGLVDETFSASHSQEEGFGFSLVGGDSDDPDRLAQRLLGIFERARREGLDPAAFRRVRTRLLGTILRSLDSLEHVAFTLLSESFRGLAPFEELALVDAMTLEDLQARLDEHVVPDRIAVAVVRPADDAG